MLSAIARLIAGVTLATLIACGSPPPASTVTSVTIDGGDRSIILGEALTLTATVEVTGAASQAVTWSSSDEPVATVAADGQVAGLTTGTADITATSTIDATKSDTVTLTVTGADGVTSVTIDGGDRTIVLGDAPALTVTVATTGAASQAVTWTSSNETIATIAPSGQVTSLTTGTTTITATSTTDSTKSGTIALTINPPGALRWTRQFGTSDEDFAFAIATDASGNVTTTGYTEGALEGSNTGGRDAFVRSYGH